MPHGNVKVKVKDTQHTQLCGSDGVNDANIFVRRRTERERETKKKTIKIVEISEFLMLSRGLYSKHILFTFTLIENIFEHY